MATYRGCSILRLLSIVVSALLFCQSSATLIQTRDNQTIVRNEMIHREHPRSPLCNHTATTFERTAAAIQRSRHPHSRSTTRRRLEFTTPIAPAGNSLPGEYVMEIFLGTPPQRFVAIVDTGSDLLWVQCAPCADCFAQPDPLFYPANSSSFVPVACTDALCTDLPELTCASTFCHFEYGYLDKSSIAGFLSFETLFLTNTTGTITGPGYTGFLFGCMNNNTGTFKDVDGLVGFGRGALSLPSQIGALERADFSYCLVSTSAAINDSTSTLFFGVHVTSVNELPLSYTPLLLNPANPSFYYVGMIGVFVNGVDLGIPVENFGIDPAGTGGVIFDSGTTLTYLRTGIIETVTAAVQAAVSAPPATVDFLPVCYQLAAPPAVTASFVFQGVNGTAQEFVLDTYNLWLQAADGVWCLAMKGTDDTSIIGNVAQSNHFVETDSVGLTIGWLSMDCSSF